MFLCGLRNRGSLNVWEVAAEMPACERLSFLRMVHDIRKVITRIPPLWCLSLVQCEPELM